MKTTVSSGAGGRAGGPAAAGGSWQGGSEGCSPRYRRARSRQRDWGGLQPSLAAGRAGWSVGPAGESGCCEGCAESHRGKARAGERQRREGLCKGGRELLAEYR